MGIEGVGRTQLKFLIEPHLAQFSVLPDPTLRGDTERSCKLTLGCNLSVTVSV